MKEILVPVLLSAFLLPGAGQMYNKERLKGLVLMILTGDVTLAFSFGLTAVLAKELPPAPTVLSNLEVRALVTRIMVEHEGFVSSFGWLMTGIWVYGVLDAYWGARARSKNAVQPPSEPAA
jgi:hypothetical protein